jgi:putative transposase
MRPSVQVRLVTEDFTSKTCGKCGALHQKLRSSKIYACKTVMDRDSNGARNVQLKYLTELTAGVAEAGTQKEM